jgi:hypothetical protein
VINANPNLFEFVDYENYIALFNMLAGIQLTSVG